MTKKESTTPAPIRRATDTKPATPRAEDGRPLHYARSKRAKTAGRQTKAPENPRNRRGSKAKGGQTASVTVASATVAAAVAADSTGTKGPTAS